MPTTHKVPQAVALAIKAAVNGMEGDSKPTVKAVTDAYRQVGNLEQAIALASKPADVTQKATVATSVTQKQDTPTPAAKPKKVQPDAPEGWLPGESREGFVRYARRMKATGHPVSEYRVSAAKSAEDKALVASFVKAGADTPFVILDHTTGDLWGFQNHSDAYAGSMANVGDLARSVVGSIGGEAGMQRIASTLGHEVRARILAIMAEDEAEEEASA